MFLLDTNVVSELRKIRSGKADSNVAQWATAADAGLLFLSAIVIQELETGALLLERRDARRGALVRRWLEDHVLRAFEERILPVDTASPAQRACRRGTV